VRSDGATHDYKFGQKNNWRRAMWNAVLERTVGRVGPILYMAGPQDLDRGVALQKGVANHDLIAVDRDVRNIASLKRAARLAIDEDVLEVLRSWPRRRRVGAVMLDFNCGLEQSLLGHPGGRGGLTDALVRQPYYQSAVMLNLQRGRDASSNDVRDVFIRHVFMGQPQCHAGAPPGLFLDQILRHPSTKCVTPLSATHANRALQFIAHHVSALTDVLTRNRDRRAPRPLPTGGSEDQFVAVVFMLLHFTVPLFFSYRSGSLIFDSVVFRPFTVEDFPAFGVEASGDFVDELDSLIVDRAVARRLGALLAVRTMRAAGA
jgi:hypothetical protein